MIRTRWQEGEMGTVYDDAISIRKKVFVEEQQVEINLEIDGMDSVATHLVVYEDDIPIACARLIKDNDNNSYIGGRIAVLPAHRGKKYGDLVMRMLIRRVYERGGEKMIVHAQISAKGFYEKLGFQSYGGVYEDAGIMHVDMCRTGDITGECEDE